MPSTYTQNLGIEQPATGEQANVWGITVNRNFATYDLAISGNTTIPLSSSTYQLTINNGADLPLGANALLIWGGQLSAPGSVAMDSNPGTRQHLHIMQNRTLGGFPVAFSQGAGGQFLLQNGYDAIIYSDGAGAGANVAAALANPQFANMLLTGTLQLANMVGGGGNVTLVGNLNVTGGNSIGIGAVSMPDPLTIQGMGPSWLCQLRLVEGNYGILFRNDGTQFFLMPTNAGDPYGGWAGGMPLIIDLASHEVALGGWGINPGYALSTSSIWTGVIGTAGGITAGGGIVVQGGGINAVGRITVNDPEPYQIALVYSGVGITYIGTNSGDQFQVSSQNGSALLTADQSGNVFVAASFRANGLITSGSGGIQFPDGTVQTTAVHGLNLMPHPVSRNTGLVYSNTQSTTMFVSCAVMWGGFAPQLYAVIGPGSSPGMIVAFANAATNMAASLFFPVPAGYSYRVDAGGAGINMSPCIEWY